MKQQIDMILITHNIFISLYVNYHVSKLTPSQISYLYVNYPLGSAWWEVKGGWGMGKVFERAHIS